MEDRETIDALAPVLSQFKVKPHSAALDIRESIALVDFYLRLIYTLTVASSRRPNCHPIRIAPAPGFGTMLAIVRRGVTSVGGDTSSWVSDLIQTWCEDTVKAIDSFKAPRYGSFKTLRDRLAHGQPLPSDSTHLQLLREAMLNLTSALERNLKRHLTETSINHREESVSIVKANERAIFEVSPLWIWSSSESAVQVYSHVSADGIHYIAPDGDVFSEKSADAVNKFTKNYVSVGFGAQPDLGKLVRDVLADIGAYTEDYSKPSYFFGDDENVGTLFVPWIKSTSENNQSRLDGFRIGPDNRREWRKNNETWVGYSDFLKHVSNWELLARRIAIGLENFVHERVEEETSRLGFPKWDPARGPTLIKENKDPLTPSGDQKEFKLVARIDESCQRMKPSTSVFFIIGQAGLGKTDLMVSAAMDRAREIEKNPESTLPLYLFVSSSGRTLSSLEDAVNSALNITKLLSSHSAKALCRNGLLVLLVDGFDELLGSSGYENALGSLEPWFRELSGRGVLVASARSSYYLTQYRRSLALATDLNVDHTLVELQPWSRHSAKEYLINMGVKEPTIAAIKEREWSVLCVPFFAKAFAAWLETKNNADASLPSVYDIVVAQYLMREALKLKDPNIGELLTTEELREIFSEIAELMQISKNREIDQSELVSCAESVIGTSSLETARPGLTRRLSSLCGLGATSDSAGRSNFGFSHEVLFDCFLSLALQRRVSGVINEQSIRKLLGASKVNASVFEWLLEKQPEAATVLSRQLSFNVDDRQGAVVLSSNLGALWSALLSNAEGIPPTSHALGLQLESLELSREGWNKLDLSGSSISRLVMPDVQGRLSVNLANSEVGYLEARSSECIRNCLIGIKSANVMSVHVGNQFEDNKTKVREFFEDLGMVPRTVRTINQQYIDSASYFLDRLARRPDTPVVLSRDDLTADDDRLSWIQHADADHWRSFVNALVYSGVARLEQMPASGKPKVRIAFNKPIASLQEPSADDREVAVFWSQF